ncbi:microcystin-dependent protein [Methylobacterium sp. BE186]|uniref:hypothetical protein n=1 Tax=Methylobacterium sp. BE186 TaxID=2817715 RepID=UPI00285DB554|nr:hypothetical protein [Methylobacterium sp. BE186]MDR7037405.1 microcystin-dependent protein [Methylobacterium sp. BE186]
MNARLSVFLANTTQPVATYNEPGLSTRQAYPVPARANGTFPTVYVEDGLYRVRITDASGMVLDQIEDVQIITVSGGGGGGGADDPTTRFQTGDIKDRYDVGTHQGWVRFNGRTIGSSASSASERANDDCHDLFVHLWTRDGNLAVSGGRGPNAESDWQAGKTITLPDARGRFRVSLEDMGNLPSGRLFGGLFSFGTATTLGAYGGSPVSQITLNEMPSHSHTISAFMDAQGAHNHTGVTDAGGVHRHAIDYSLDSTSAPGGTTRASGVGDGGGATGQTRDSVAHSHTFTTSSVGNHAHNITASATATGSGAAFSTLVPFILVTTYVKL